MAIGTRLRNTSGAALPLPWPYKYILGEDESIIIEDTQTNVRTYLGGAGLTDAAFTTAECDTASSPETAGIKILYADLKGLFVAADSALPMNGQKITGLGAPAAATDASTKGYVDTLVGSIGGLFVADIAALTALTTMSEGQTRVVIADATGNRSTYTYSATSTEGADGDEIVLATGAGRWYKLADDESRGIRVQSAAGLAKNTAFAVTSYDPATKAWIIVAADNTNPAKQAAGVLGIALGAGGTTIVADDFLLAASGLDTSGGPVAAGDSVWYDNAGALTLTEPTAVTAYAHEVGKVSTKAAGPTGGVLRIRVQPVRVKVGILTDARLAGSQTGRVRRTGTGTYDVIKDKLDATVDPLPTNDTSEGYIVGSLWFNTATFGWFQCDAIGAGVAKWSAIAEPMVINKTGGALAKSLVVALSSYDPTTGLRTVVAADSTSTAKPAAGVLGAQLGIDGTIPLRRVFLLAASGLATNGGCAVGDPVYFTSAGALTLTKPTQPASAQIVARVATLAADGDLIVSVEPQSGVQFLPQWALRNAAPAVTDDSTAGFAAGSWWWDQVLGILYIAKSVGTGTAEWIPQCDAAVINTTGGALAKAKAVTLLGFDAATGLRTVALADSTNAAKPAVGVLPAQLGINGQVVLRRTYLLTTSGLDTMGGIILVGDPVYFDATGGLTVTRPNQPASQQVVAYVATINASASLLVSVEPQTRTQIAPLGNFTAVVDPVGTDDNTLGYGIGSPWFNTATGKAFQAISVATGLAVWTQLVANKYSGTGADGPLDTAGNVTLDRLREYSSITVNAGHTLTIDGFSPVFGGTKILVKAGGIIKCSGGAGFNGDDAVGSAHGAGGGAGPAVAAGYNIGAIAAAAGGAGGDGQVGIGPAAAVGVAGNPGVVSSPAAGIAEAATGNSGTGGNGGAGDAGPGGAQGALAVATGLTYAQGMLRSIWRALGVLFGAGGVVAPKPGASGGSGGGGSGGAAAGATETGGGGGGGGGSGAGGGMAILIADAIEVEAGGFIVCGGGRGGNGGAGADGASTAAGAAGGGGGGGAGGGGTGGALVLVTDSYVNAGTVTVTGGAAGTPGAGGAAVNGGTAGTAGDTLAPAAPGADGRVIVIAP